jgi:flagellar basal-body rod protein FlgB
MPNILFDPISASLERALDLRVRQHGLTASNVANADTPGYKAQHLDFEVSFERAVDEIQDAAAAGRRPDVASLDDLVEVREAPALPGRVDGNSVRAEVEMVQLSFTQAHYDATVEVMNRRFAMLEYAASDGGR